MPKYLTREQKVVNLPASDLLTVLQDASLIFPYVEKPIQREAKVTWEVTESQGETPYVFILGRCSGGHTIPVLSLPEKFFWSHCGKTEPVPPEIVKKFYALQKQLQG
jgi:hypothetical protein